MAGTGSVTPLEKWRATVDWFRGKLDVDSVGLWPDIAVNPRLVTELYDYAAVENERAEGLEGQLEDAHILVEQSLSDDEAWAAKWRGVAEKRTRERDEARQVAMQLLRLARAAVRELSVYEEASVTCPTGADMATWLRAWATLGDARDDAYFALSPALRRLVEE
jgi:hypothetical protein